MRALTWSASVLFVAANLSVAVASPKSVPPPRLNALDIEAGALLVGEPESAGAGIADGAAWHVTDGRDDAGWRSPEGAPQGASFVWELDALWRLDTLVVSTKGIAESEPGLGVKTIALFVAPQTGEWTSVGRYTIGKRERRTITLPQGTTAARLRAVILENHGNTHATELSELSAYGARVAPLPGPDPQLTGDFRTSLGTLRFAQTGQTISGCYDIGLNEPPGVIAGFASGRVARVFWADTDDAGVPVERTATFTFSADRLRGTTYTDGQPDGVIWGVRVPTSRGPACRPAAQYDAPVLAAQ